MNTLDNIDIEFKLLDNPIIGRFDYGLSALNEYTFKMDSYITKSRYQVYKGILDISKDNTDNYLEEVDLMNYSLKVEEQERKYDEILDPDEPLKQLNPMDDLEDEEDEDTEDDEVYASKKYDKEHNYLNKVYFEKQHVIYFGYDINKVCPYALFHILNPKSESCRFGKHCLCYHPNDSFLSSIIGTIHRKIDGDSYFSGVIHCIYDKRYKRHVFYISFLDIRNTLIDNYTYNSIRNCVCCKFIEFVRNTLSSRIIKNYNIRKEIANIVFYENISLDFIGFSHFEDSDYFYVSNFFEYE